MRTRTLLLLAVACGVAILAAGVGQFIRLAAQDEPARPVAVGAPVTVGDLRVVVEDFEPIEYGFNVVVELSGVDDPDAIDDFRLVVPGESVRPLTGGLASSDPPDCTGVAVAPRRCTLLFTLPENPGTTRVLVLRRGDEHVRWELVTA